MRAILALLFCFVMACPPAPAPPPVESAPATDPPPPAPASCGGVCAHMALLGCPGAHPSPAGASCVVVCENLQASGIVAWNLACRAAAPSCQAIDRCELTTLKEHPSH